jgi:hypothetical protein
MIAGNLKDSREAQEVERRTAGFEDEAMGGYEEG